MKKLTKKQKRKIAEAVLMKDGALPGMPAAIDWSGAEIGEHPRPAKKPVTMRLDADVLEWLKSYGEGYQTKANMLLRHAMMQTTRAEGRKSAAAKKA
jgi:uncharacterized protein (DUF4415 family)